MRKYKNATSQAGKAIIKLIKRKVTAAEHTDAEQAPKQEKSAARAEKEQG